MKLGDVILKRIIKEVYEIKIFPFQKPLADLRQRFAQCDKLKQKIRIGLRKLI